MSSRIRPPKQPFEDSVFFRHMQGMEVQHEALHTWPPYLKGDALIMTHDHVPGYYHDDPKKQAEQKMQDIERPTWTRGYLPDYFRLEDYALTAKAVNVDSTARRKIMYGAKQPVHMLSESDIKDILEDKKAPPPQVKLKRRIPRQEDIKSYRRVHPHLGFDEGGIPIKIESSYDVEHGMTYGRAKRELDVCKHLLGHGVLAPYPLGAIEFPHLEADFGGNIQTLGRVATWLPTEQSRRFDILFDDDLINNPEKMNIVGKWLNNSNVTVTDVNRHQFVGLLYESAGAAIRRFNETGLYRYSGYPNNLVYSEMCRSAFLTDLDSVEYSKNLTRSNRALYLIRDAASLVYGIMCETTRHVVNETDRREIGRMFRHHDDIVRLMESAVQGYFPELSRDIIHTLFTKPMDTYYSKIAEGAAAYHHEHEEEYKNLADKTRGLEYQNRRKALIEQRWFDRFEAYAFLVTGLSQLYRISELQNQSPLLQSHETLTNSFNSIISANSLEYIRQAFPSSIKPECVRDEWCARERLRHQQESAVGYSLSIGHSHK